MELTDEEKILLDGFNQLNSQGQRLILEYLELHCNVLRYQKGVCPLPTPHERSTIVKLHKAGLSDAEISFQLHIPVGVIGVLTKK